MKNESKSTQNKIFAGVGVVVLIAALFFLVSSFSGPSVSGNGIFNTILSSQDFMTTYKATRNAELVDVRTPAEFDAGHIAGAVDIDYEGSGFEIAVKALDPSKTYFVYCRSGNRSGKATAIMQQDGIAHIYQLQGGVSAAPALLQ
ncbi:MAG: rhodanese-like domain-containing protein [bacterium]